ncbi:sugar phosphate phosphate translocator-like [Raphidocelis subcapitata]|uniref:Sugar phosphate phosphate translocator-like n=1 Tax=Raphidocelis subcapitata TaxID=307507 RepID=A0A2V0P7K0_9CHLO|nr:sugar phosphate phosphate translocator-like [Raphidocelis subcapitata]|eukprot:GBF95844.1 sugar phosphate phosphate translocator-like [Raphidocelis subcapitata]
MGPRGLVTLSVIILWYTSNVGVLLLNKHLLSNTGFKQPVFLTLCHMLACSSLAYALSLSGAFPIRQLRSRRQVWKVSLLASIFCVTIVLGNMSLRFIAVSFSQAVGSGTPFFTAVLALALQGTRESRGTYAALFPIVLGVIVASGGEPQFHALGFAACVLATAARALKSVVQSMLLSDPTEKLDPMSLLFYMSSFSVLLLLPATAILEPGAFAQTRALVAARPGFLWWLLLNSSLAYAVNLTNFMVTKHTSALTLQVLGNMKGVIAAAVSVALFRNVVTARGLLGYAITVAGVFAYSESKRRARATKAAADPDGEAAGEPLLPVKAGALGGGGGGGTAIGIVASSGGAAGLALSLGGALGRVGSGGGLLSSSAQQLQQHHRSARSGGGSVSVGGVPVVAQQQQQQQQQRPPPGGAAGAEGAGTSSSGGAGGETGAEGGPAGERR